MPVELQIAAPYENDPSLTDLDLPSCVDVIAEFVNDGRLSSDLCVRVCDTEESLYLNANYRGKDKPTNVLSFSSDLGADAGLDTDVPELDLLGDLAICWPVVQDEAVAQGKRSQDHFYHLFVHGVLHLLGFDHEAPAQADKMEALERDILARMDIADPYR